MKTETIYWRRMLTPDKMQKLKARFHISGITVNGLSIATIDDGDEEIFRQCIERGFFVVRHRKKNENAYGN